MDFVKTQKKISKYSYWMMITTSIHHLYGAYIYDTPERLHVLVISIPIILLTLYFDRHFEKHAQPYKKIPTFIYSVMIFVFSLLLIGVLEGMYNHILKNILFFSNISESTIIRIFYGFYDAELIEMPNDVIFEVTGIAQGLLAIPLGKHFIHFAINQFRFPDKTNKTDRIRKRL